MRKFLLLTTFFLTMPLVLISTMIFALFISYQRTSLLSPSLITTQTVAYAALPSAQNVFDYTVIEDEGRVEKVRQFLSQHNSPLEEHAAYMVQMADAYNIDYRLIPAIAMQESNLCRRIPLESHNCWGFGIYGKKVTMFSSYPEAIETVTRTLATKYKDSGLISPNEIMSMYTPSSDGDWAASVTHFMEQL